MEGSEELRDNFVDYARLGLALSVCLFHMRVYYGTWPHYYVAWAVPGFLSISGYYVLRSYEQSGSWREFLKRRVLRIGPPLILCFLNVYAARGFGAVLTDLQLYATAGVSNNDNAINIPLWSLGAEEVAYVLLAVLFALGAYRRKVPIFVAFCVTGVLAACLSLASKDGSLEHWNRIANLAPAFFAGSLVYIYRDRFQPRPYLGFVLLLGALALPTFYGEWANQSPFSWVSGTLMGIGILNLRHVKLPRIPDFSYGCYIYHVPIFAVLNPYTVPSFGEYDNVVATCPAWQYFSCLLLVCAASWYCVEKPILGFKSKVRQAAASGPEGGTLQAPNFPEHLEVQS